MLKASISPLILTNREVAEARQRLLKQAVGTASSSALLAQAAGLAGGTIDKREVLKLPVLVGQYRTLIHT